MNFWPFKRKQTMGDARALMTSKEIAECTAEHIKSEVVPETGKLTVIDNVKRLKEIYKGKL